MQSATGFFLITFILTGFLGSLSGFVLGFEGEGALSALVALLLTLAAMAVALLVEEAGHYLTARALGFRATQIQLGNGPLLFQGQLFGASLTVHAFPSAASMLLGSPSRRWLRVRLALVYLARPAALACALALLFFWRTKATSSFPGLFIFVFAVGLLSSLYPRDVVFDSFRPGGKFSLWSNGKMLWMLPRLGEEVLSACRYYGYVSEQAALLEAVKPGQAITLLEEGLNSLPGDQTLRSCLGAACLHDGDNRRARQILVPLLESPSLHPHLRPYVLANIALANLGLERELLGEAAKYAEEAMRAMSGAPVFTGIQGMVLIRLGRVEEGLALLRGSMKRRQNRRGLAFDTCWLAIGHALLGQPEEARRHLEKARRLDPRCPNLRMATDEVAAAEEALASARAPSPFRSEAMSKQGGSR